MSQSDATAELHVPWHLRQHEFLPGDVVLCKASRAWLRRSIGWATRMEYVHGGIYVGEGMVVDTSIRYKNGAGFDRLEDLIDPVPIPIDMDDETRQRVVEEAQKLVGTPFPSWLPMAAGIFRRHKGDIRRPYHEQPWWVRGMLNGQDTLYCVQLPWYALKNAGIHLFDDGRHEGLVLPRDFATLVPGGLP